MTDLTRDAVRAAVEKHCHIDTRWPCSARIDDMHMEAFISDLRAALRSPPVSAELVKELADAAENVLLPEMERLREVAWAAQGLLNADTYVSDIPRGETIQNATIKLQQKLGIWHANHNQAATAAPDTEGR